MPVSNSIRRQNSEGARPSRLSQAQTCPCRIGRSSVVNWRAREDCPPASFTAFLRASFGVLVSIGTRSYNLGCHCQQLSLFDDNNIRCHRSGMNFSARVIASREHAKLTQEALAKAVGISQQAIQKMESGQASSSRKSTQIAVACGVRPEWLATGEGEMVADNGSVIAQTLESQAARYQREKMELAATFTQDWFERENLEFSPRTDWDIVLGAYEFIVSDAGTNVVHLDQWLEEQATKRGLRHVRQREARGPGKADLGTNARKTEKSAAASASKQKRS